MTSRLALILFIRTGNSPSRFPILLLGHSWGAFGVCGVLNFDQSPKAVVEMSGYVSPDALMLAEAKSKAGPFAELTKPDMDAALKERAGTKGFLSAVSGINKAKKTPVLLIQGGLDETVPVQDCSIFDQDAKSKTAMSKAFLSEEAPRRYLVCLKILAPTSLPFESRVRFARQYKKLG
jgi:hypothetical protein